MEGFCRLLYGDGPWEEGWGAPGEPAPHLIHLRLQALGDRRIASKGALVGPTRGEHILWSQIQAVEKEGENGEKNKHGDHNVTGPWFMSEPTDTGLETPSPGRGLEQVLCLKGEPASRERATFLGAPICPLASLHCRGPQLWSSRTPVSSNLHGLASPAAQGLVASSLQCRPCPRAQSAHH